MLAESSINTSANSAAIAAQNGRHEASSQICQYLPNTYAFQPIALERLGPIQASVIEFLSALGQKAELFRQRESRVILVPTFIYRSAAL